MRQTFMYKPGDIRVENVPDPKIVNPTDAIIRIAATCVCGSDLWDYRGINPAGEPRPIGHEYVGVVEETGGKVRSVTERGDKGIARVKELTGGIGADSVLECVGMPESMTQALRSARPGGNVGFVGVPHGVHLPAEELFYSHVGLRGGPAPVRRFLPDLIDLIWKQEIDPGKVFDLVLPLEQVADGYKAMDERRAIKTLLRPETFPGTARELPLP